MRPIHLFISVLAAFATPVASQIDEIIDVAHFADDTPARELQSGVIDLWEIPDPDINFNEYRLMIDYTVRDSIENTAVTINMFRDNQCTRDVTFNEYLSFDIIYDDTPLGDGTGTRTVRIGISIEPTEIQNSRVISYVDDRAIVSFCLRFKLYDLDRKDIIQNSLDTILNVGVVLTDDVGIVELVGDQVPFYGIDTYRCNSTNGAAESLEPISQGQIFRFCMVPNNWTLYDGIYIRSIDSFTWSLTGGDLSQTAITTGQRIGDGGLTAIDCDGGSKVCVLQSIFMNDFFTSPAVVQGIGIVVLQFGGYEEGDRRSLRVGVAESRALYEIGEFVTTKEFGVTANIQPSEDEFLAEVYECNSKQEPVNRINRVLIGQDIRVCVRPDEAARAAGTYMRIIESFSFKRGSTLVAVEPGGEAPSDGSSLVLCSRGDSVCSFKTQFPTDFFLKDGTARGTGVAILQYGPESGARRLRAKIISRIAQTEDGDPGYAGSSQLSLDFDVAFSKEVRTENAATWWMSSATHLKTLFVMGIIIAVMLVCCCFGGCMCLYRKKHLEGPSPLAADRDLDESIDAFMDSKASFYSDDEFFTDSSESSDESSSEEDSYYDYDDEDDIASMPALTPPQHGLSQSMHDRPRLLYQAYPGAGLSSSLHGRGRGQGRGRGRGQGRGRGPPGRGYHHGPPQVSRPQDGLSSSTHARPPPAMYHPNGITSIPRRQDGLSSSIHGGRGPTQRRPSSTLSTSQHGGRGPAQRRPSSTLSTSQDGGRGPAQRRPSKTLSTSQHGGRRPAQRRPSNTLSTSQHGCRRPVQRRPSNALSTFHPEGRVPAQRRPSDGLSTSQHAPAPLGVKQWKEKAIEPEKEETKGKLNKAAKQKAKNVKAPKQAGKKGGKKTGKLQKSSVKTVESPVDEDPSAEAPSSIPLTISTDGTGSEEPLPEDADVCFDAGDHPGTVAFLKAVRKILKKFADEDFSPPIYRAIKKLLPDRKFFICDDEDELNKWREPSKSELIDLFWKYYDEERESIQSNQ